MLIFDGAHSTSTFAGIRPDVLANHIVDFVVTSPRGTFDDLRAIKLLACDAFGLVDRKAFPRLVMAEAEQRFASDPESATALFWLAHLFKAIPRKFHRQH